LWVPHVVIPAMGAAVCVWVMVSATTLAKIVAAVWLVAGVVVFLVGRRRAVTGAPG
jgi:uncharacterized membrane protein YiaA